MQDNKILDFKKSKFYQENKDLFQEAPSTFKDKILNKIDELDFKRMLKNQGSVMSACEAYVKFDQNYINNIAKTNIIKILDTIYYRIIHIQLYFELIIQIMCQAEKYKKTTSKINCETTILSDAQFHLFYKLLCINACFEVEKLLDGEYQTDDDANVFSLLKEIKKVQQNKMSVDVNYLSPKKRTLYKETLSQSLCITYRHNNKIKKRLNDFFHRVIHKKLIKEYKHVTLTSIAVPDELLECYAIFQFLSKYFMQAINNTLFFDDCQIHINNKQKTKLFGKKGFNHSNSSMCWCNENWLTLIDSIWQNGQHFLKIKYSASNPLFVDCDKRLAECCWPQMDSKYKFNLFSTRESDVVTSIKNSLIQIIQDNACSQNIDACHTIIEYLARTSH